MGRTTFLVTATLAALLLAPGHAYGDDDAAPSLEERIEALEMDMMTIQADQALTEDDDELELIKFAGGSRSLQKLNPELSFTGDFFALGVYDDGKEYLDDARTGLFMRALELHLQSNLDPFSMARAVVVATPEEVAVEELYATWTNVLPRLSITAGLFRQQLGTVNRWHEHALEQFNYPLMILVPLGEAGLMQTGVSFDWLLPPLWADSEELTLQVTNGSHEDVFAGEFFSIPTTLVNLKSYWDLSESTYLELGLTGVVGFNNKRGVFTEQGEAPNEELRMTMMAGLDLALSWVPPQQAKYKGVTWRMEALYIRMELPDSYTSAVLGGYTSLETKLGRSLSLGARGDLVFDWAEEGTLGDTIWQVGPYLTIWQSEYVMFRVEYDLKKKAETPFEHLAVLQLIFSAGPHKHEKY